MFKLPDCLHWANIEQFQVDSEKISNFTNHVLRKDYTYIVAVKYNIIKDYMLSRIR